MPDLRIYNPDDLGPDGYPFAWNHDHWQDDLRYLPIKDQIRAAADHRCERCGHPYFGRKRDQRISQAGQWSPCDDHCTHDGPTRERQERGTYPTVITEAQWRILTVHHLNGVKWDCRWWNLVALCQVCHLTVQGRVRMEQVYPHPHSPWFQPHAAGYYASAYLGQDLSRDETMSRLEELLALELDPSYRES